MAVGNLAYVAERREEDRDEVFYRARAIGSDGKPVPLLIVNISPHGLMARCELPMHPGEALHVTLPGLGAVKAEVRWALGGRVGCQFARPVALAAYYELLATLLK